MTGHGGAVSTHIAVLLAVDAVGTVDAVHTVHAGVGMYRRSDGVERGRQP